MDNEGVRCEVGLEMQIPSFAARSRDYFCLLFKDKLRKNVWSPCILLPLVLGCNI